MNFKTKTIWLANDKFDWLIDWLNLKLQLTQSSSSLLWVEHKAKKNLELAKLSKTEQNWKWWKIARTFNRKENLPLTQRLSPFRILRFVSSWYNVTYHLGWHWHECMNLLRSEPSQIQPVQPGLLEWTVFFCRRRKSGDEGLVLKGKSQ